LRVARRTEGIPAHLPRSLHYTSVQPQPLDSSRLAVSSLKVGTDETAVAQRSSQALVP